MCCLFRPFATVVTNAAFHRSRHTLALLQGAAGGRRQGCCCRRAGSQWMKRSVTNRPPPRADPNSASATIVGYRFARRNGPQPTAKDRAEARKRGGFVVFGGLVLA